MSWVLIKITDRLNFKNLFPILSFLLLLLSPNANATLGGDCNPFAVQACGLPFPSDFFRDSTSGKLTFTDAIFDRRADGSFRFGAESLKAQFPDKFTPTFIFNNSNGFSPVGPIMFELPDWPKDEIPKDGTGILRVFDTQSGAEIPMVVSLSRTANPKRDLLHKKTPVIIAWPQTRFDYSKHYVAVLLKNIYNKNNVLMQPNGGVGVALGFFWLWPNSPADKLKNAFSPTVSFVAQKGIDRTQILSITDFTIKTEGEVTKPLLDMVAATKQVTPIISNLKSHAEIGSKTYGAGTLQGTIQLLNFRSDDGGIYPPYKPISNDKLAKSDFVLTLPKWDQSGPVPLTIWGHGLGNEKSATKTIFIRDDNVGVATFAIDHPNHGSRINPSSPYIGSMVHDSKNMMQLLGMFVQSAVDQSLVIHAATDAIPSAISSVPGTPALDGSRLAYQGLSMGGMVGAVVGAVNPELKGAYLANGSGSLMQIFSESLFWDGNTSAIIPSNASGAEVDFVLAMMQHYVDIADGVNFASYYRNPLAGGTPVKLAMQYSIGDGNVPNSASLALAELVKLPLLKSDAFEAVPQLPYGTIGYDGYEDGYGILQTSYGLEMANQTISEVKSFDANYFPGIDSATLLDLLVKTKALGVTDSQLTSITSLINASGGLINTNAGNDLNSLINTLYTGDLESFLTHFHTSPLYAVLSNIKWNCDLLNLDQTRCDAARTYAIKTAQINNDPVGSILTDGKGSGTGTGTGTNDGTGNNNGTDNQDINKTIQNAVDDGKAALNDLKQSANKGSGGSIDFPQSILLGFLIFIKARAQRIKKLIAEMVRIPAMRVIGSALSAAITWGGWAFIANVIRSNEADFQARAIKAGLGQASTSFVMTIIGSLMIEFLFIKLFYSRYRNIVTVLAVSSVSLTTMICVHTLANTPRIILTIVPIYTVVVLYCSAYVKTLSVLNRPASS